MRHEAQLAIHSLGSLSTFNFAVRFEFCKAFFRIFSYRRSLALGRESISLDLYFHSSNFFWSHSSRGCDPSAGRAFS